MKGIFAMSLRLALLLAATLPVACSGPPPAPAESNQAGSLGGPAENAATPAQTATTAKTEAGYLGRWKGVEGMFLDVKPKAGGGVAIENQWDLDHKGNADGSVTAEGLRWLRDGAAVTAVASDGDATGLKYLAGKKDCLTVKPGEGYCRD